MQKIDVKAFALAWGISFSVSVSFLGWAAMFGWGVKLVDMISSLYIGYAPTFIGGIIGGVWAFFDWAIGAGIVAIVYNALVKEK